jgi:hypothetical protein
MRACRGLAAVVTAQLIGLIFVDRAGVGYLFGDAEFVQLVDDLARLDFQLPRQLIDSNLTHIEAFRLTALQAALFVTLRVRSVCFRWIPSRNDSQPLRLQ